MPPRFAYWTILIDNAPTAFRARDREELLPTLNQLKRKSPSAIMKWFARGRLWASREEEQGAWRARTATHRGPTGRPGKPGADRRDQRGRDWRPGGQHKDPRARFRAKNRRDRPPRRGDRPERRDGDRPPRPRPERPPDPPPPAEQIVIKPEPPERGRKG